MVKNLPTNAGDTGVAGSIPGSGRCSGGGHGNPLQCSYPWTEEPGGLKTMGLQIVGHITEQLSTQHLLLKLTKMSGRI